MASNISEDVTRLKTYGQVSDDFLQSLLLKIYRLLDSQDAEDYNTCLCAICHIANTQRNDKMVQQLLHDCIIKSRIFLYDNLLLQLDPTYDPYVSAQDHILQNYYTSKRTHTTLTKPQKEIFDTFQKHRRLIVSAPTSFGKTRIVREIISHNHYKIVALIMPTVSLLSEQYQELKTNIVGYVISKSSKIKIVDSFKYILVLTPERMSCFLEENPQCKIDFFVMDEIYKADCKLDDDRFRVFSDILYRLAKTSADFYLIGPYITDFSESFRKMFNVALVRYDVEIVQKDYYLFDESNKGEHFVENVRIRIVGNKFKNLLRLTSENLINGKFLIYRYQKQYVEDTAMRFAGECEDQAYNAELTEYLTQAVSAKWDLISCIRKGIGFHHGAMPRHIQDLIVDEFNTSAGSGLNYLFCTTSLTEGINSAAKNVVIFDKKIGEGDCLKTLDRKNIEGRAGRFMQHFIGRVFYLESRDDDDSETNIEIEFLDQDPPSIEALIQIEEDDVKSGNREIYEGFITYLGEQKIPHTIIKQNRFVGVGGQVALINYLRSSQILRAYIFEDQLPSICFELMLSTVYDYLFTERDKGKNFKNDVGKSILISLTQYYYYYSPSFKELVEHATVKRSRSTDNSRIRFVFDLMSKYFEFVWPKYLKAFERLFNFVAKEKGLPSINLDLVIAKLEYGTTKNHEIMLRDLGMPNEIVRKISKYFKDCKDYEEVQAACQTYDHEISSLLHPIELRIMKRYM